MIKKIKAAILLALNVAYHGYRHGKVSLFSNGSREKILYQMARGSIRWNAHSAFPMFAPVLRKAWY